MDNKFKFYINYNSSLLHFVDHLSKWDYYVEPKTHEYFKKNFGITKEDEKQIKQYCYARSKMSWEDESVLFEWARKEFPTNNSLSPIKQILEYFEQRKNKEGITLENIIKNKLDEVNILKDKLNKELEKKNYLAIFKKASILLNTENQNTTVDTYLFPQFGVGIQGGANGSCIYAETSRKNSKYILQMILHEYFHKTIKPGVYFKTRKPLPIENLYLYLLDNKITNNTYFNFCNEVLTHTFVDTILFNENPDKVISEYQKDNNNLDIRVERRIWIWKSVKLILPIIQDYIKKDTEYSKTRAEIDKVFYDIYTQNK